MNSTHQIVVVDAPTGESTAAYARWAEGRSLLAAAAERRRAERVARRDARLLARTRGLPRRRPGGLVAALRSR